MNSLWLSLCNPIDLLPLKPSTPHHPLLNFKSKTSSPPYKQPPALSHYKPLRCPTLACAASDIDMVKTKDGVFTAKPKKVVVLWDLDNKPPRGPPYEAAMALKRVAQCFGDVVDISAYANRHAFIHLPQWVLQERRERRHLDILEHKGVAAPPEPYVCGVCGRKYKTNLDLKKHFKQLHERERQKKLNRMRSLKGKKRQRFKERFIDSNFKYQEAAKTLIRPKVGYGLAAELRRAGVFVKTVEDKPQAADWAVKRQMLHSMSRGVDWLFLISDDSDFSAMLKRAKQSNLGTVVVGDWHKALGRHADLWVPWIGVENGQISEEDLLLKSRRSCDSVDGNDDDDDDDDDNDDELFSVSKFDGGVCGNGDLDSVVDELVGVRTEFNELRVSAFSEGEEEEERDDWVGMEMSQEGNVQLRARHSVDDDNDDYEDDFFSDSDDEF